MPRFCPLSGWTGVGLRLRWPRPWRALRRLRRNARAVAALEALDDRMLKDIGVERSEIESVVRGLGRDASRVDRTEAHAAEELCNEDILRRRHP